MVEMNFEIIQNLSNPKKVYDVSADEEVFFNTLIEKSNEKELKPLFNMTRTSNGTINVNYDSYPIGKIKLQGRTKWMMVMNNLYDSNQIEGSLDHYIEGINDWILYIEKYIIEELS